MSEKLFWKSALKASILTNFVMSIVFLVIFLIFLNQHLLQLFHSGAEAREALDAASGPLSLLSAALMLSGGLYSFVHKFVPIRQTIVKVLLFNAIMWGVSELFINIPEVDKIMEAIFKPLDSTIPQIILFIISAIVFSVLFDYFRKEEAKSTEPKADNLASVGRRLVAFLIDAFILTIIGIVLFVFLFTITIAIGSGAALGDGQSLLFILSFSLVPTTIVLPVIYWVMSEAKFGATIGKRLMRIRVVKEGGTPIGYQEAFFRNAWKFFSGFELAVIPDVLFLLFTKNKQRFFDKVGGTIVVNVDSQKQPGILLGGIANENIIYGGLLIRGFAYFVDTVVSSLTALIAGLILLSVIAVLVSFGGEDLSPSRGLFYVIFLIIGLLITYFGYFTYFIGVEGQTPGQRLFKLRVMNKEGKPIGYFRAFIRTLALYFLTIIFILPLTLLLMFLDRQKQGIHDKIVGSYVVAERPEESSAGNIPIEPPSKGKASIKKTGRALYQPQ